MDKILKTGIQRENGWLYYVSKDGFAARSPMARGKKDAGKKVVEKLSSQKVDREKGFLYFIDTDGDIARVKMARTVKD